MNEKLGIALGIVVCIAVISTFLVYLNAVEKVGPGELLLVSIPAVIVIFAVYILWEKIKSVRSGTPTKDERVINISYKAGYYGFIAAIWSAVGAPLVSDIIWDYDLEGSRVTAAVVLVSGLVFVASYLYLSRKGN